MSNNNSVKPAIFSLPGFIKEQIAKLSGFHHPKETPWKLIPISWWLKFNIAIHDLRTFFIGSKTDDQLCGKRWMYLIDQIAKHRTKIDLTMDQEVWLDELIELSVDKEMAYFEMLYHRDGKQKYSWSREDMSEESIAALPDWWFDGTRAKRQLRKIRGN